MNHRYAILAALSVSLIWPVASTSALGRDADGSRMQARPLSFGMSTNDRLSPPSDSIDWHYVRMAKAEDATLTVETTPSSVPVDVTVTDAMGKTLTRGRSSAGTYTSRRRLDPGLYYIAVSSTKAVHYRLTVK